ncbi:MAG TPA: flagellin FliC, partial [Alcanivorax sp.]|nr:flagellin FliC [Alcanivorax sp.]
QTTGLAQAQRNANDGISVAQTAEGALNQVNDNLQRVRELTVQAQNDTNSQSDLNSIQDEINQRLDEINRVSQETNFNGVKVLAEDQEFSIQVGANDGEKITMNLKEINAGTLGLDTFNVNKALAEDAAAGDSVTIDGTSYDIAASGSGVNGTASTTVDIGDVTVGTTTDTAIDGADSNDLVFGEDGTAYVKSVSGSTTSYYEAELSVTDGTATSSPQISFTVAADAEEVTHLTDTAAEAATSDPLASLDSALSDVDSLRSEMGAMQNRFDSAITNLSTTETNLSAARSRIEDADYAVEVSNMTRAQILQQAGTSVLAQANQVPQSVLSLLG